MATEFNGFLDVGGGEDGLVGVGYFDVVEQYNGGWNARAVISAQRSDGEEITLPGMTASVIGAGVTPGDSAVLRLAVQGDEKGKWVRNWPCFIRSIAPFSSKEYAGTHCVVNLVDAVNHFAGQTIWGAFRGHSAAEMVGGALSLAAGTEGAATLAPRVEDHPSIKIVSSLRDALDFIPYSIAAGQELGRWLAEFYGLLGIRMEMLGASNGELSIMLADGTPNDTSLDMTLLGAPVGEDDDGEEDAGDGELRVTGVDGHRGLVSRGVLLDDPTKGMFRRIATGPIGALVSGVEVSLDEAAERAKKHLLGRAAELLVVTAESRQSAARPGRTVALDRKLLNSDSWQISRVEHIFKGSVYGNRMKLMKAEHSWHPRRPSPGPTRIMPAAVDAGSSYLVNEPVPRDHLGRILIRFPFLPNLPWEERAVRSFDRDYNDTITKDDFAYLLKQRYTESGELANNGDDNETEKRWRQLDAEGLRARLKAVSAENSGASEEHRKEAQFLLDAETREQEIINLYKGEYDDPYPDKETGDLTEEEEEKREEMSALRLGVFKYMAWKRALAFQEAGGDYDRDARVTVLDETMSEEMREVFEDPEERKRIEELANEQSGEGDDGDSPELSDEDEALVEEYQNLFGEEKPEDEDIHLVRLKAAAAGQQSPPRLPLIVLEPMAGGLHGFVTAHRQGDACRVAVYNVLSAEILGFQYRDDRDLTEEIRGMTAGIVVEHNTEKAWSGLVFRRTD